MPAAGAVRCDPWRARSAVDVQRGVLPAVVPIRSTVLEGDDGPNAEQLVLTAPSPSALAIEPSDTPGPQPTESAETAEPSRRQPGAQHGWSSEWDEDVWVVQGDESSRRFVALNRLLAGPERFDAT